MSVSELDDATVLAALQELTARIREDLSADQQQAVTTQEEAQLALASIIDPGDAAAIARRLRTEPLQAIAAARDLLTAAVIDPDTSAPAAELVANPPAEDQMAVLGGLEIVILLAALITLLQTKARIRVDRKDGKVNYQIDVEKNASPNTLLEEVARIVAKLFGA